MEKAGLKNPNKLHEGPNEAKKSNYIKKTSDKSESSLRAYGKDKGERGEIATASTTTTSTTATTLKKIENSNKRAKKKQT